MSVGIEPPQTFSSSTLLRTVSPQDLFNLPLYEHHLVIDTRSPGEYAKGHIATAVSLPSPDVDCSESDREKFLVQFIKSYVKEYIRPENPSPVVLYGSSQPECMQHVKWLARKLEKLQMDHKAIAKVEAPERRDVGPADTDELFDPFEYFCHTIADRVHEIWILEGGYDAFCSEYNFLCGQVTFESMFPLPHQISPNLFLGSRVVPLTKECLSKLRITHMIVSSYQKLDWGEFEGISILRCDVQDKNKQDMIPCWRACTTFISEAISPTKQATESAKQTTDFERLQDTAAGRESNKQAVRILGILHGRSRSTSVVLAYLIKTLRIRFEEAWAFVCKNCWHLIDRSLVYEDQLREWDKTETRSLLL